MNPYPNPSLEAMAQAPRAPGHPTLERWLRAQRAAHEERKLSNAVWIHLYRRYNEADERRRAQEPPWRPRRVPGARPIPQDDGANEGSHGR